MSYDPSQMIGDIVSMFKALKFTDPGIAGGLGNIELESHFDPTAENTGEGAIGFAQWEKGRRQALQAFASANNSTETNPHTQIAFMMTELSGPYSSVLTAMQHATDPAAAAKVWDLQYEGSADTNTWGAGGGPQRVQNAQNFYAQFQSTGGWPAPGPGGASGSGTAPVNTEDPQWAVWAKKALSPNFASFNPLFGLFGTVHSVQDAIKLLAAPFMFIGEFFQKILWIMDINHFWKVLLYVFGAILVASGFGMIVFGAGKERPA